jgi:hypothetical protein
MISPPTTPAARRAARGARTEDTMADTSDIGEAVYCDDCGVIAWLS